MEQHALYWGKPLAEKTHAREPPTPGALASFVHSAPKALEIVVEVEHPPTSECLGDGVATEMQLLGLAVYQKFPAEQGPPRRASELVHGCMAGMVGQDNLLVKKVWKLVSNDADFINIMNETFACDGSHVHSQRFDLKATQHYPQAFARVALEALRLP